MTGGAFLAMPVYRGMEMIEETLRSILAQTFEDFHLVMSVDGSDDPTIEICRKYTHDPRIDMVVQERHLGWPGNFNWLFEHCDREFFCYWQQDDLASTGYLENLRTELLARPDASIAYTDVQWFGERSDKEGTPSIEGDPLTRIMQQIEGIRFEPLRGLMRASMLPQLGDAIPVTEDESCQEEFVFLTKMAAAGAFVRVEEAMYFKRMHRDNVFSRWRHFPDWRRRRGWISMGAGMHRIARQYSPKHLLPEILAQIIDRLAIDRPGRAHFYIPAQTGPELGRFVRDFVSFADVDGDNLRYISDSSVEASGSIHPEIRLSLDRELAAVEQRANLRAELLEEGSVSVFVDDTTQQALVGYGWSVTETWGVWSDGGEATIRIPAPRGSSWRATIEVRVYAPGGVARVGYSQDRLAARYLDAPGDEPLSFTVESQPDTESLVRFHLPDARAPRDDALSKDARKLGIGLTRIEIELIR